MSPLPVCYLSRWGPRASVPLQCVFSPPRRIELRALRKVSEGEEITVSYVDFLDTSAERRKKLQERFHFDCSCQHCQQRLKDELMTAAAEGADGGKVGGGDREATPQRALAPPLPASNSALYRQVQEVTTFSNECLEKIDRCLLEGGYQEVRARHCCTCACSTRQPWSVCPPSPDRSWPCAPSVWRGSRTCWRRPTCSTCGC